MAAPPRSREATLAILLAVLAAVLIPLVLFVGYGSGRMDGGGMGTGWDPLMLFLVVAGVLMFALLLLVPGAVQPVIPPPWPYPGSEPPADTPTALQILDRRYALGDITQEDYLRMRQDLEGRKT